MSDSVDNLADLISTKLKVEHDSNSPSQSSVLYYSISVSFQKIVDLLDDEQSERFRSVYNSLIPQNKFHITVYYPKKGDLYADEYKNIKEGTKCRFIILSIGLSEKSCVLRLEDDIECGHNEKLPYYGNPIRHITIASAKDVKPADSTKAFDEGIEYLLREPILCEGTFTVVRKSVRRQTIVA
jgi:hypothetical protein